MRNGMKLVVLAVVASLATGLALSATVGAKKGGSKSKGTLKAKLTGAAEVPGPGDPDGRGKARVEVLRAYGAVCFRLSWSNIEEPTRGHIHRGVKGEAGPIVVTFFEGTAKRRGCTDGLDDALLREIKRRPRGFYVNLHNADFPAGAIRGQLKRSGRNHGRRRGDRRSSGDGDGRRSGGGHYH